MQETFGKHSILFKVKDNSAGQRNWIRRRRTRKGEGHGRAPSQREDLALTLHFVQPEEYFEYFED